MLSLQFVELSLSVPATAERVCLILKVGPPEASRSCVNCRVSKRDVCRSYDNECLHVE